MEENKLIDWKIVSAIVWLIFTVTLAGWWMSLGLQYYSGDKRGMIIAEGLTLIAFLTGGGIALIYYILQEKKRNFKLNQFFASANHELKTYMASLRLRAEGLSEDLSGKPEASDASKIVDDTVRLELQLENSLIFSEPSNRQIYFEKIELSEYLNSLSDQWPALLLRIEGKKEISADRRMLDVIFKNLIQNALVHGKAKEISISLGSEVIVSNDGEKFNGDLKKLGMMFYRHEHKSRSGIGLYLVKTLLESMGGKVTFSTDKNDSLNVILEFKNV